MKIAAIYDIHGNLPALNALLEELEAIQPDLIVCGGDIASGPLPGQTLERLFQLGDRVRSIRGNGDRAAVAAFDNQPMPSEMPEMGRQINKWVAEQLTRSHREFLANLPEQITLQVEGLGEILFCHATPRSDEEIFTPITPQDRLDSIFSGVNQRIVVCGHTHMQFEMQVGETRIINAGSVGMPYADSLGAYWLLLSPEGYEFRRTPYDREAAAEELRKSSYPGIHRFVEENVLKIPTAEEATNVFEGMSK